MPLSVVQRQVLLMATSATAMRLGPVPYGSQDHLMRAIASTSRAEGAPHVQSKYRCGGYDML